MSLRPELADLGRLWRRMAGRLLGAARAEDPPTVPGTLAEHLGPDVGDVITLASEDLATALDQLLDERNRLTRVLLGGSATRAQGAFPPGISEFGWTRAMATTPRRGRQVRQASYNSPAAGVFGARRKDCAPRYSIRGEKNRGGYQSGHLTGNLGMALAREVLDSGEK